MTIEDIKLDEYFDCMKKHQNEMYETKVYVALDVLGFSKSDKESFKKCKASLSYDYEGVNELYNKVREGDKADKNTMYLQRLINEWEHQIEDDSRRKVLLNKPYPLAAIVVKVEQDMINEAVESFKSIPIQAFAYHQMKNMER